MTVRKDGLSAPPAHDHVCRNHSCGSTCSSPVNRASVVQSDLHQYVFGRGLGIFDENVVITVVIEDPGVDQLVLGVGQPRLALVATRSSYGKAACGYL